MKSGKKNRIMFKDISDEERAAMLSTAGELGDTTIMTASAWLKEFLDAGAEWRKIIPEKRTGKAGHDDQKEKH